MKKLTLHIVLFFATLTAQAQYGLKDYTISSHISPDCATFISVPLFPKETKQHLLNSLIIRDLTAHHFMMNADLVNLNMFYEQREFSGDSALAFTIMTGCTFGRNGIYSFTGCPYNACDKRPMSEMETVMTVIDSAKMKSLVLKDIIEPAKYDSFVQFSLFIANRYRIKNIPTCSYASTNPVVIKSSSASTTQGNEIVFSGTLDTKFYIKPEVLIVHLIAQHSRYPYATVELPVPINLVEYFLKDEYRKRIM